MNLKPKSCLECGATFQPKREHGLYCSAGCRASFRNRRANRGADLIDLFVAMRSDRSKAKELNVWTAMCQLELAWREEDQRTRPGLRSTVPVAHALQELRDAGKLNMGVVLAKAHQVGRGS